MIAVAAKFFAGDQVNGYAVVQQLDVAVFLGPLQQGIEDGRTSRIGGVNDASVAVPPFAGEVKVVGLAAVFPALAGEGYTLLYQPADGIPAVTDNLADRVLVAQAAAGDQSVLDMGIHGVGIVEHCRYATLGPESRAFGELALAQDGYSQVAGQVQGEGQAGSAAADDQYVVLALLGHVFIQLQGGMNAQGSAHACIFGVVGDTGSFAGGGHLRSVLAPWSARRGRMEFVGASLVYRSALPHNTATHG